MAQVMTSVTSSCELGHRTHEQGQTSLYSWVSERLAVGTKTLFRPDSLGTSATGWPRDCLSACDEPGD